MSKEPALSRKKSVLVYGGRINELNKKKKIADPGFDPGTSEL